MIMPLCLYIYSHIDLLLHILNDMHYIYIGTHATSVLCTIYYIQCKLQYIIYNIIMLLHESLYTQQGHACTACEYILYIITDVNEILYNNC